MSEKWNASVVMPNDTNYIARCIEATFGPAKSSNNVMITLKSELIAPAMVEVAGKQYTIGGVTCTNYYAVTIFDGDVVNVEKTKNAKARIEALYKNYGLSTEGLDWENLDVSVFKGKCVCVQVSSDQEEQRKAATADQIAEAKAKGVQPQGDILTNPVTGAKLVKNWPKIREVFGPALESALSGAAAY